MSEVLFIRHGETAMAGRFCGHADPGLNAEGREQVSSLVETLATEPIVKICSSDLRRARETAAALALSRGLTVQEFSALREMSFGQWEGRSWHEIEALDPEYAAAWVTGYPDLPAPHGEHYRSFAARVLTAIQTIVNDQRGLTAVITHAGVMRVVLTRLLGCSEPEAWQVTKPYCSLVRYAYEATGEKS